MHRWVAISFGDLPDPGIDLLSLASPASAEWVLYLLSQWGKPKYSHRKGKLWKVPAMLILEKFTVGKCLQKENLNLDVI